MVWSFTEKVSYNVAELPTKQRNIKRLNSSPVLCLKHEQHDAEVLEVQLFLFTNIAAAFNFCDSIVNKQNNHTLIVLKIKARNLQRETRTSCYTTLAYFTYDAPPPPPENGKI